MPTKPTAAPRVAKRAKGANRATALAAPKAPKASEALKPEVRKPEARKPAADLVQPPSPATNTLTFPEALAALPAPTNIRERILHAAVALLNDEGFASLTQHRVAERAGVRQSHITYYFPVRNDLLRETAVYGCNALLESLSGSIEAGLFTANNFRDFLVSDISDRRFARLVTALVVASDEDDRIKPWLASFESANRDRLIECFHRLGFEVSMDDIEMFHAAYVGAVFLDLGESSDESLARSQRIVMHAYDQITRPKSTLPAKSPKRLNLVTTPQRQKRK